VHLSKIIGAEKKQKKRVNIEWRSLENKEGESMKRFFDKQLAVVIILGSMVFKIDALALYASQFNATYNIGHPLVLTETTTIYLDEDIVINGAMPFSVDSSQFSADDQLIFTSTAQHKLILKAHTLCDFSSFLPDGQTLFCTGNMEFIVEEGCVLRFDDNLLIFDKTVKYSFKESTL
jgi:hypothetical protein